MLRLLALLPLLAGCAGTAIQPALRAPSWASEADRPTTAAPQEPATPPAVGLPLEGSLEPYDSRTLPGGLGCLIRLRELEIPHRHLSTLRGVDTPVEVTGPVGGVEYRAIGRHGLVADCRLVLALDRAARYLRNLGVTAMYFSGAYSYRMMPSGRPSRHAMGLAIDVHHVEAGGRRLTVAGDYDLDMSVEDACAPGAPTLNRMACLFKHWRLFDRVLTPDFDGAHYNHFHLAILELNRRRGPRPRPVSRR